MRVIKSGIHGYGCVTTRRFKAGDVVSDVDGVLRHEDEDYDDTYSLYVDGTHYYDMVDQNRWINHSCDPNCEVQTDIDKRGNGWAKIVAVRDIKAGEELHYDYAFPAELAEKCNCGADACRGWIVDPDEQDKLKKRLARQKSRKKSATTTAPARPESRP